MEKYSTKQLRILPLSLIAIVAIFTFGFLIKMSFEMRAEEFIRIIKVKFTVANTLKMALFLMFPKPETRQEKLL